MCLRKEYHDAFLYYKKIESAEWSRESMIWDEYQWICGIRPENLKDEYQYYFTAKNKKGKTIEFKESLKRVSISADLRMRMATSEVALLEPKPDKKYVKWLDGLMGIELQSAEFEKRGELGIAQLRLAIEKYPESVEAYSNLAWIEMRTHHFHDAWDTILRAKPFVLKYPADRNLFFTYGLIRKLNSYFYSACKVSMHLKNYEAMFEFAHLYIKYLPDASYGWYILAKYYKFKQNPNKELECLKNALEIEPADCTWNYLVARKCLDMMILDPPLIVPSLAQFEYVDNQINQITEFYTPNGEFIGPTPGLFETFHIFTEISTLKGRLAALENKPEIARNYFKKASKIDHRNPFNNTAWGVFEYSQKNFAEAKQILQKSINVQIIDAIPFIYLAKIYLQENNYEFASKNALFAIQQGAVPEGIEIIKSIPIYNEPLFAFIPNSKDFQAKNLKKLDLPQIYWNLLASFFYTAQNQYELLVCLEKLLQSNMQELGMLNNGAILADKLGFYGLAEEFNKKIQDILKKNKNIPPKFKAKLLVSSFINLSLQRKIVEAKQILSTIKKLDPSCPNLVESEMRMLYLENRWKEVLAYPLDIPGVPMNMIKFLQYYRQVAQFALNEMKKKK
ncbi:hypothetical protein [Candidatus Harpocratesius sp.]